MKKILYTLILMLIIFSTISLAEPKILKSKYEKIKEELTGYKVVAFKAEYKDFKYFRVNGKIFEVYNKHNPRKPNKNLNVTIYCNDNIIDRVKTDREGSFSYLSKNTKCVSGDKVYIEINTWKSEDITVKQKKSSTQNEVKVSSDGKFCTRTDQQSPVCVTRNVLGQCTEYKCDGWILTGYSFNSKTNMCEKKITTEC